MRIEMSVSDARAKRRALVRLRELGYRATSGPIRMSEPFTVVVTALAAPDVVAITAAVVSVDPGAVRVATPAAAVA